MDHEKIARQLVRAVRGKRSQKALSLRLGYRTNPVAEWEGGRRFPTADEFLRVCRRVGIDVDAIMKDFDSYAEWKGDREDAVAMWLRQLVSAEPERPLSAIALSAGLSRHTVSRLLSGQTRPRLPQFLALADALTQRMTVLVDRLVTIAAVPELQAEHQRRMRAASLGFEFPWTAAVLVFVELENYRALPAHVEGWFACRLGVSLEVERATVDALLEAGILVRDGDRLVRSPLNPNGYTTRRSHGPGEPRRPPPANWGAIAAERCLAGGGYRSSYAWIGISLENYAKLTALHASYLNTVRQIAMEPQKAERALLTLQYVVDYTNPIPPSSPKT